MDRKSLKQYVLETGYITIDKDGACNFVVTQINDENFKDISPMFKQQLEEEGKYNWWIGFFTNSKSQTPHTVQVLPIYGNSKRYVTKWFTKTPEESIEQSLRDKQVELLKRANDFI